MNLSPHYKQENAQALYHQGPSILPQCKLKRLGMMRLWQDKNTIIPALIGCCEIFDKIAITYHKGANDDGCVDLVRNFLREKKNGSCEITLNSYPYPVYFVHDTWYKYHWFPGHPGAFSTFSDCAFQHSIDGEEKSPHLWVKLDTDTVYIPEALEQAFNLAEYLYYQKLGSKILLLYHDTTPFEGKLWWTLKNKMSGRCADHCLYNPYFFPKGYKITQGDDEGFIEEKNPLSRGLHREVMKRACGFQFRKQIWLGPPKKVPVRRDLLNPLNPDVIDDFERFIRPLLIQGQSVYADLNMSTLED